MTKKALTVMRSLSLAILGLFLLAATQWGSAQDINASLSGTVMDPSSAVIPGAKLTLVNEASGFQAGYVSDAQGAYSFQNLIPGKYDLSVTANGFKSESQKGIELAVNQFAHLDIHMSLGQADQTVQVSAETSLINYETQTLEGGVSPEVLEDFPLVVSGAPRSSVAVATMMPGVTSGAGDNPFNERINGGLVSGDEAIVDGVTAEEGFMNQSGMVALQTDFGMSPDITSEVHVLTANYDAEYGNTTSGQLIIQTKSGGERFHGGGYEYLRNDAFNAIQYGNSKRPPDKENDFGTYIGGPVYLPGLHGANSKFKGYFYFNWEGFQDHGGAVSAHDTIASTPARTGNFSGWGSQIWYPDDPTKYGALAGQKVDASGLGHNMIDPKFEDPIAKAWLAALPTPTSSGELNNYYVPISGQGSLTNSENVYFARADLDIGSKDHLYYTYWWQYSGINTQSDLPVALSNAGPASPENAPIQRFNWEHIFNSRLTNHFSFGYLNRNEGYYQLDKDSALPKVPGVASTKDMPQMSFTNYTQLGTNRPANSAEDVTTRGTYGLNDVFTAVFGKHTLKGGFEWKKLGSSIHNGSNLGGTFSFAEDTTGNTATGDTGDDMASFFLGAVSSANTNYYNVLAEYPRQYGYAAHLGDEWRVTPKFIANLSMRWDYITPFAEKFDNLSFFDPNGLNPGAIVNPAAGQELPGRLAYAGTKWGAASYGAPYPEIPFKSGWSPRVGFAYTLNEKTVVRAGYGIYYGQAFYPGWNGGMSQDGYNKTVQVSESPVGSFKDPALYLQNGISAAQTGSTASTISSTFDNGGNSPNYRPLDGNRRPYSQEWSMTLERQLPSNFYVQLSYVGTKGTHLPSDLSPLNVLNPFNPTVQALGDNLKDTFTANQSTQDGVSQPYVGWASQMTSCHPTVAQALVPYPMMCGTLQGQNEQHGTSIYNSFQGKVERHLTHGLYVLGVMTVARLFTDSSTTTQSTADSGGGNQGNNAAFSPFMEKPRAWALAPDNVPVTAQLSAVYSLPFGKGQRWANDSDVADAIIGGWRVTPLFHYDYGTPYSFYSSNCITATDAGALREQCIPGILPGQTVQLHGRNGFDPKNGGLYFNPNAFEPASVFSSFGYTGTGNAVTSVYGPSYKDWDISLAKDFKIVERVSFKFAANFFDAFNNHALIASQNGSYGGPNVAFVTDVNKLNGAVGSNFGQWNGGVTTPRTIQFSGRLEF
ncbi:MAG: carboxypeptidase regulatory-like domain-containing protein [Terracidiphilus sp.]